MRKPLTNSKDIYIVKSDGWIYNYVESSKGRKDYGRFSKWEFAMAAMGYAGYSIHVRGPEFSNAMIRVEE